jgi:hypothetical protein
MQTRFRTTALALVLTTLAAADVGGDLAAELLPWQPPTVAPFTGDLAPLVGTGDRDAVATSWSR